MRRWRTLWTRDDRPRSYGISRCREAVMAKRTRIAKAATGRTRAPTTTKRSKTGKGAGGKSVESLRHEEARRRNIPTAEYQSVLQKEAQDPIRVAYERRNRDLDPQLVWRGKDEQDWSDLVVHAPPLYIQEKVHPKALIDDLLRQTRETKHESGELMADLFADFNGIPKGADKTDFYQHDQNWSNRMVLGDSLQVMASMAERE